MAAGTIRATGKIYTGETITSTVQSAKSTTISQLTLPPGRYVITGAQTWTTNFNQFAAGSLKNDTLSETLATIRGTGANGGTPGVCISVILDAATETVVKLEAYQESGSNKTVNINELKAIRID